MTAKKATAKAVRWPPWWRRIDDGDGEDEDANGGGDDINDDEHMQCSVLHKLAAVHRAALYCIAKC